MIKKITMQQAIFMLSNLQKKEAKLKQQFYGSCRDIPLKKDGESVVSQELVEKNIDRFKEYKALLKDIVNLKKAIHAGNNKVVYESKTLNDLLIEAKTGRQYLSLLEVMIHDSRISLEPNLGVIEYGNPNIEMFEEEIESLDLENKLNELSQLIEKLNTEVEISVDLENA